MSDTEQALLDFVAATRDALDLPLPGIADADRELHRLIMRSRSDSVKIAAEMIADGGNLSTVHTATSWLRDRTRQLPVTYRPYECVPEAREYPGKAVPR